MRIFKPTSLRAKAVGGSGDGSGGGGGGGGGSGGGFQGGLKANKALDQRGQRNPSVECAAHFAGDGAERTGQLEAASSPRGTIPTHLVFALGLVH